MLGPTQILKCIKRFIECIHQSVAELVLIFTPITVARSVTEVGAGAGSVPVDWISVTLINQGDTTVDLDGGEILLPGTTVRWDLKGFANRGDAIPYIVAAPGPGEVASLVIVEVR